MLNLTHNLDQCSRLFLPSYSLNEMIPIADIRLVTIYMGDFSHITVKLITRRRLGMSKKNKPLTNLKNTVLSRGFALTKMTVKAGAISATSSVKKIINSKAAENIKERVLLQQADIITTELGKLKGTVMKAGQQLSVYGEHFFPPEVIEILKKLQADSPSVAWEVMEKTLKEQLSSETRAHLQIDPSPAASASLGQVYRASYKSNNIAIKIQYPKLDSVIDADLKAMKKILKLLSFLPKNDNYDQIFDEIKTMMQQELNYTQELVSLQAMFNILDGNKNFVVPKPIAEISTTKILSMSFEPSFRLDSLEVQNLSQEDRNFIAKNFLELYFRELFEFKFVQTDPHLGNYGVRINESGRHQLVLYDYGAVKEIPNDFFNAYKNIIIGSLKQDRSTLLDGAMTLNLIKDGDPEELVNQYIKLCFMITEPFWQGDFSSPKCPTNFDVHGNYNFVESDLPKRIATAAKNIILGFNFRTPPKELIFLDRKMGGTFTVLSTLKANIRGRDIFDNIFTRHESHI